MWRVGKVIKASAEAERFRSLAVEVTDWEGHRPGQHVAVRLTAEDGSQVVRDYSIASSPEESLPVFTVEKVDEGGVSSYLVDELQVGNRLELCGPLGEHFVWEVQMGAPLLLVAGGSGIVPLMSMIRHRAAVNNDAPTRLLYSLRSPKEFIYRSELERLTAADESLEVIPTFTNSPPPGWEGARGRVNFELLQDVAWPPEERPLAYISGPTQFVEKISALLLRLGYEPAHVKTEFFG